MSTQANPYSTPAFQPDLADLPVLAEKTRSPSSTANRYTTLDATRGVSALLVALFHVGQLVGYKIPEGYIALDLFFASSGFVIALNYTKRLQYDMTWRTFMTKRFIRLYPLYILGDSLGILRRVSQLFRAGAHEFTPAGTLMACVLSLFMLPTPPGVGSLSYASLFPTNGPSWSLFLEVAVNLLFATSLFRLPTRWLFGVCMLAASYLAVRVSAPFWLNVGWEWSNFDQGVARTLYSFPMGMLLWRWKPAYRGKNSWIALAIVATVVGLLFVNLSDQYRKAFDLNVVLLLLPALLFLSINFELPHITKRFFIFLSDISFAVYAIHGPLVAPYVTLCLKLRWPRLISSSVFVIMLVLIGGIAHHYFDIPVRRRLSKWQRAYAVRSLPASST